MGISTAYIYTEGNTKVARAALCIWHHTRQHLICHASSVATLFALQTLTNPLITFSLSPGFSDFVSSWGRVPDFIFLRILRRQLGCFFVGQCWTELVSTFARSIERYDFHPILKLRLLLFASLGTEFSGRPFSHSGVGISSCLMTTGVLRYWMGRDKTRTCMEADSLLFTVSNFGILLHWGLGDEIASQCTRIRRAIAFLSLIDMTCVAFFANGNSLRARSQELCERLGCD